MKEPRSRRTRPRPPSRGSPSSGLGSCSIETTPSHDTGLDGSGTSEGGPPPSTTTGDDTTGSGSDGDGGAVDGEGGGCSCTANNPSRPGWALALFGLVALTRRRRRAALARVRTP